MTTLAVLVGITVIGIPISLLLLVLGCYPLAKVVQTWINGTVEWTYRDHAMENDEPKPWEE